MSIVSLNSKEILDITIQVHNKFQSIPVKGDKNQFHLEPYLDPNLGEILG